MAVGLIDGHYLLHRVLHVPHLRVLATKDGKPTGGTFGFVKSLRSTLASMSQIKRLVVVFDGGRSKRRRAIFDGYKNRKRNEEVDADGLSYYEKMNATLRYLKFLLPRLGVKVVQLSGREGDDVIGLLVRELDDKLKIVVSDDRDMYQLVGDDTHVWRPIAEQLVTNDNFEEIAKCKKEHWLLRKSVLGDSSDTIPGIKGVGEKTIQKVIDCCEGDIGEYPYDRFFEAALLMPGKKNQLIPEHLDIVLRNIELIDIEKEEFEPGEVGSAMEAVSAPSQFDVLAVKKLFIGFEFFSLVEDYSRWVTPFQMLQ